MRSLDFAALQDKTTGLAAALALLLTIPCAFRTQPRDLPSGTYALVDLLGTTNGGDELIRTAVAPNSDFPKGSLTETVYGIGERIVQVTAVSIDQRLDKSARAYLEPLERKLRWSSSRDRLRALGLSFIAAAGPIQILDPEQFGRVASVASIDLRFAYGIAVTDAAIPVIAQTTVHPSVDGHTLPDVVLKGS